MSYVIAAIAAYVFAFVGSLAFVGPITVLVFSKGAMGHHGAAFKTGLGAACAEGLYAFTALFAFSFILGRHPTVIPIANGVTACVCTFLGVRFAMFWKPPPLTTERPPSEKASKSFMVGFTTTMFNPTLLATWSAVVAFLYSHRFVEPSGLIAIPFGIAAFAGVATWEGLFVELVKRFGSKMPRKTMTWVVRVMGMILIAVAIWSVIEIVRWIGGDRPPLPGE